MLGPNYQGLWYGCWAADQPPSPEQYQRHQKIETSEEKLKFIELEQCEAH